MDAIEFFDLRFEKKLFNLFKTLFEILNLNLNSTFQTKSLFKFKFKF